MPKHGRPANENTRRPTRGFDFNPFSHDRQNEIEKSQHLCLKELEGLDPEAEIVFQTNLDPVHHRAKVRELKAEIQLMADPEKSRHNGLPYLVAVVSDDPDAFFGRQKEKLRASQLRLLKPLEDFPNDQLVWYVMPNVGIRPEKSTAGDLRRLLWRYDEDLQDSLSHAGGIRIVSTDPDFDPERYEMENNYLFGRMIRGAVGRANARHDKSPKMPTSPRDLLLDKLFSLDDAALVKYRLPGSKKILKTTAGNLRKKIILAPPQDMENRGLPELIESSD
jgi:hypothetical protein